ncbi:hypothetical protein AKJ55_01975 [candidate division MSBL1 archaeon SCGC-AAA382M17]|uniref:Uncharacterized protein n=1 Tax=candidate division MSBL1 archaeon SCGC-AAA382M17 TaxID=1698284 RepID=A0ABR5TJS4_9EURY|nr:hypothetical protein AKJ55_01975 [candidate division MSBL1 archaeon SCGC-AAA382M17]
MYIFVYYFCKYKKYISIIVIHHRELHNLKKNNKYEKIYLTFSGYPVDYVILYSEKTAAGGKAIYY